MRDSHIQRDALATFRCPLCKSTVTLEWRMCWRLYEMSRRGPPCVDGCDGRMELVEEQQTGRVVQERA